MIKFHRGTTIRRRSVLAKLLVSPSKGEKFIRVETDTIDFRSWAPRVSFPRGRRGAPRGLANGALK